MPFEVGVKSAGSGPLLVVEMTGQTVTYEVSATACTALFLNLPTCCVCVCVTVTVSVFLALMTVTVLVRVVVVVVVGPLNLFL